MTPSSRSVEPRKVPLQPRAQQTRERLVEAAALVFARHGYSSGTTNRIAEEAGVSVGSLYQYFPNKDAILVALVRHHIAEGSGLVASGLADTGGLDLPARLAVVIDAMLEAHKGDPRLHQVLFEEAPRPPDLLLELHELEESVIADVEQMIRSDAEVQVRDPAMAARLVVTAVESLIHRYISSRPEDLDLVSFRSELLDMLTGYLYGPTADRDR